MSCEAVTARATLLFPALPEKRGPDLEPQMGPTKTDFGRESDRPRLILVPELQSGAVRRASGTIKANLLKYIYREGT